MNVPGMICFTLVVSLLLAQTDGRAFNNVQAREKRQTDSCDGGIRYDNVGEISTNGEYSNNENCCWQFEPEVQGSTWTITFHFDTFDVESSANCDYDALTFNSEDGSEKECGQKNAFTRTFTVTESEFSMCFTSDGSVTKQGFSGYYTIAADDNGSTTTSSSNYPDYVTSDYSQYATTSYPDYVTSDYSQYATTSYPDYVTSDYSQYATTSYPDYVTSDYSQYATTSYPDYVTSDYSQYATTSYPDYVTSDYSQYATTSYPDYVTSDYNQYATTSYPDYVTSDYSQYATTSYPDYATNDYPQYATTNSPDSFYNYMNQYRGYFTTPYPYHGSTDYPDYVTSGYSQFDTTSYPDYAHYYDYFSTPYPYFVSTDYPQYGTTGSPYYNYNQYPDYVTAPNPYFVSTDYPQYGTTGYPYYNYNQYPDYLTTPNPYYVSTDYPQYGTTGYPYYNYNQYPDYVTNPYPNYFPTDNQYVTPSNPDYYYNYNQYGDYFTTPYPDYPQYATPAYPVTSDFITPPVSGSKDYYGNHGSICISSDGNYDNNQDVCYSLHPSFTGSGIITFVFNVFDIEEATDCVFDYIEFDDANTKLRECGTVDEGTQKEFEVRDGSFNVCFHSDASVTGRGFQATYAMNPVQEFETVETTPFPVDYIFNSTMSPNFTEATTLPVETTPYPVDNIFNSTMSPNLTEATTLSVLETTPYPANGTNSTASPNITEATALPENITVNFRSLDDTENLNTTVNATGLPDEHGDCNLVIDDLEGTYTLATDSEGQYENNQHCDITIRSQPTPHITTVNFTRFDLEGSGCIYDSLTITSDEATEKLCGSEESFIRQYTGQSVDMTFTSDGSVQRSGFSFDYVTEIVYCNATINAPSGTFESLPGGYENNMYCTYTINTPGPGELVFSFPSFNVESGSSCPYDAVEMGGDRLCGTNVEDKTYSTDGHFQIVFTSDGSVTGDGFRMNFNFTQTNVTTSPPPTLPVTTEPTIPTTPEPVTTEPTIPTTPEPVTTEPTVPPTTEPETCSQVLTADNGTLTSPGNGSYPNNEHCVTVITGPNVPYTLVVSFTTFDLESSSNCRYDYLEVDMGLGNDQKGCGSSWSDRTLEYTSDGGNVTLTFSSDSSQTGAGYTATYSIQPRGVPSLSNGECMYLNANISEGVIQSLPGTGSNYPNNMDCSYVFTRNNPFYLNINFTALDTESSSNCGYDYVQVGDDKYCGSDLPNATRVSVQGGSAIIRFRSDSSVTGKGFVASFSVQDHCNYESDDLEGTYTLTTDSEGQYENNQHCDINIRSPSTPHITTVNFTRFNIEDDAGCDYDSLTVTSDGTSEKLCGAKESFIRQYTDPLINMTFTSDGSVVRSGFSFNYITEVVYCNATINATSGTFESQPGGYDSNMNCSYTINTPGPGELVFSFPLFDVESGSSCRYDAVEMGGDRLCGTNVEDKTFSTDGHFQFVFTSDGSVNGEGFKIDFSFIPQM